MAQGLLPREQPARLGAAGLLGLLPREPPLRCCRPGAKPAPPRAVPACLPVSKIPAPLPQPPCPPTASKKARSASVRFADKPVVVVIKAPSGESRHAANPPSSRLFLSPLERAKAMLRTSLSL
jgi:hypothetical protein